MRILPPVDNWPFGSDYPIATPVSLICEEEMYRDHLVRSLKGIGYEAGSIIAHMAEN